MASAAVKDLAAKATQEEANQAIAALSPEERSKLIAAFELLFSKCRYEKKMVEVKGKNMAYIEIGKGDPIVFVHGNPTYSYMWRNVIPHCEQLGRIIVPDLIGMGDSDKLDNSGPGSYLVPEQIEYFDGFLEAVGVKQKVTFVVHSWGGVIGASWAERHKDQMKGFAFMEAPLSPDTTSGFSDEKKAGFKAFKSEKGEEMILQQNFMIEGAIPKNVMRKLSEEEHNEYRRPFLEPGEGRRAMHSFVASVPIDGEPEAVYKIQTTTFEWLKTTELPKLFINGDPGSSVTPEEVELVRGMKKITEEVVKGTHLLTEDSPDEIGTALVKWYGTLA